MYEYVRGKLAASAPSKAIVDVGGIGFSVSIGLSTYSKLPQIGSEVFLYLSPVVREDAHLLYGFLTTEDRDFFEKLTQISGVGPKTALALLGHLDMADLQMAIFHGNAALLSKAPGIGKKIAERIVVEMKDKVKNIPISSDPVGAKGIVADAISALVNLGYHPAEAQKAVKNVLSSHEKEPTLAQLISLALRTASRV